MANPPTLERWVREALMPRGAVADTPEAALRAARATQALEALNVRAIPNHDPEYPSGLRALRDPPPVLFARGSKIPSVERAVAVVGSRAASPYGLQTASRLASDLTKLGFVVVSGLARGIDASAHQGALAGGGTTIAVLPSGIDHVTPTHHRRLAEDIAASGTLVTEIAAGGPRFRGEFVKRNRLIAGLCAATVVVEAAAESGGLTTARVAASIGRVVLAVPGDVDRPTSHGTHGLLRRGARLCENAGDVARAIAEWRGSTGVAAMARSGPTAKSQDAPGGASAICSDETRMLEVLETGGLLVEDLAARAGLDLSQALAALLALQWAGVAVQRPGQRWARA